MKAAKKPRRVEQRTVLVIRDSEHAAVRRRPKKGLLAGLYELPNTEGHLTQEQALKETASFGFSPIRIRTLEDAKHIFSHVEWQMKGYLVLVEEQEEAGGGDSVCRTRAHGAGLSDSGCICSICKVPENPAWPGKI